MKGVGEGGGGEGGLKQTRRKIEPNLTIYFLGKISFSIKTENQTCIKKPQMLGTQKAERSKRKKEDLNDSY